MKSRQFLEYRMAKHKFKMFSKKERSSFPYWYYHWKAFNLVAHYLGVWKFKYLFHDFEKPWLRLVLPYEKVQKIHRKFNSHHLQYRKGLTKIDWEALIIDNECCRFSKKEAQLNARDYIVKISAKKLPREYSEKCFEILDKLGL